MTFQLRDFKLATSAVVVTALIAGTASGCGGDSGATTPTPPPPPVQLAVFTDPTSASVTTSNVRDAQEEIVRFDLASGSLIWAADGRMFTGYPVSDGYFLRADRAFQVRFGTKDGERRAYFTETVRGTICDLSVVNGVLMVLPTDLPVPGGG